MATKAFKRTDRVSAQLRRELGTIVHAAARDHGLPSTSVSDVEVTRDMAHAKVFVTVFEPGRAKEAVKALKALAPELRYQLAPELGGDAVGALECLGCHGLTACAGPRCARSTRSGRPA